MGFWVRKRQGAVKIGQKRNPPIGGLPRGNRLVSKKMNFAVMVRKEPIYWSQVDLSAQLTTIPRLSHAPLSLHKADMGHGRSALRTVRSAHHHHHRKIIQSCQNFLQSTLCMHVQDSRHLERSMDASVVDACRRLQL
jgi:hypothetical protein